MTQVEAQRVLKPNHLCSVLALWWLISGFYGPPQSRFTKLCHFGRVEREATNNKSAHHDISPPPPITNTFVASENAQAVNPSILTSSITWGAMLQNKKQEPEKGNTLQDAVEARTAKLLRMNKTLLHSPKIKDLQPWETYQHYWTRVVVLRKLPCTNTWLLARKSTLTTTT